MAMAPPRPCSQPKCGRLACQVHIRASWRTLGTPPPARIQGRKLQLLRARLFQRQPWCVTCLTVGRHTRPTIRDHVINLREGGADDETNEQALCKDCSDLKTTEESKRGVKRNR